MTIRSPDCRKSSKSFKYSPTSPPGLERIRTSARAGTTAARYDARTRPRQRTEILLRPRNAAVRLRNVQDRPIVPADGLVGQHWTVSALVAIHIIGTGID